MRIVTTDDVCMEFFSKLPGFTYQYARYTDWIDQFLTELTKIDEKSSKALTKDQALALKDIKSTYSRYETFLNATSESEKINNPNSDTQLISTSAPQLLRTTPLPYMLLKSEKYLTDAGINLESSGLILTAQAMNCTFVPSQPTNCTNLSVSQDFLSRFSHTKVGGVESKNID